MSKKEEKIETAKKEEEKPIKKKATSQPGIKKSTLWLDLLTYLLIPLVTFLGIVRVIRSLLVGNVMGFPLLFLLIEISFIVFHCCVLFNIYNRNKSGYILIRALVYAHALYQGIYWAIMEHMNKDANILMSALTYLAICAVAWVLPNEIYFKARKHLFKNEISFRKLIKDKTAKKDA